MSDWENVFQRHANTDGVSTATEGMFTGFAMNFAKMLNHFVTMLDTFLMD